MLLICADDADYSFFRTLLLIYQMVSSRKIAIDTQHYRHVRSHISRPVLFFFLKKISVIYAVHCH